MVKGVDNVTDFCFRFLFKYHETVKHSYHTVERSYRLMPASYESWSSEMEPNIWVQPTHWMGGLGFPSFSGENVKKEKPQPISLKEGVISGTYSSNGWLLAISSWRVCDVCSQEDNRLLKHSRPVGAHRRGDANYDYSWRKDSFVFKSYFMIITTKKITSNFQNWHLVRLSHKIQHKIFITVSRKRMMLWSWQKLTIPKAFLCKLW